MIQIDSLSFSYPAGTPLFQDYSFFIGRGQAWAIIGPSGCGKTTLLSLLAGLILPVSGQILIDGQELKRPRPRTGLVLQDYGLLPWASVWDNVRLGLQIRAFYGPDGIHSPKDETLADGDERADHWLSRLGIDRIGQKYPHQISGGQRQRAAIARTLVLNPDLLLMDEPFGALDLPTRLDLQNLTMQLRREQRLTTVIVTHNIEEAAFMGEHILVLTNPPHREPVVVANPRAGESEYRPSDEYTAKCQHLYALIGDESREMA